MGFCRLLKTILFISAVVIPAAEIAAETQQSTASATIQVTATVVPAVGIHAPDDVLLVSTPGQAKALGLYEPNRSTESSAPPQQLVMHYPSSGILLSVDNGSTDRERLSFEDSPGDSEGPGTRLVDLEHLCQSVAGESGDIVLTIIYTEN